MRVVVAADFGGSLTKVVLALVGREGASGAAAPERLALPPRFLPCRPNNPDLRLVRADGGASVDLAFFSFQNSEPDLMLDFFSTVMGRRGEGVDVSPCLWCTGGGVARHRRSLETCGFSEIRQMDEIQSLRRGMEVLAVCSKRGEFYTVPGGAEERAASGEGAGADAGAEAAGGPDTDPECTPVSLPESFILMQVGSGLNVMSFRRRASSEAGEGPGEGPGEPPVKDPPGGPTGPAEAPAPLSFEVRRVDGSSIGGASCYGLGLLLTGGSGSYAEFLRDVAAGDSNGVDMVVGDIYGKEGYECAGLNPSILAASAGRVALDPRAAYRREDALASIFGMGCINIAHVGSLNARLHRCEGMVFTGSFFQGSRALQQKIRWAVRYYTQNAIDPVFVGHDAVLGCLGALAHGGLEPRGRLAALERGDASARLAWE